MSKTNIIFQTYSSSQLMDNYNLCHRRNIMLNGMINFSKHIRFLKNRLEKKENDVLFSKTLVTFYLKFFLENKDFFTKEQNKEYCDIFKSLNDKLKNGFSEYGRLFDDILQNIVFSDKTVEECL